MGDCGRVALSHLYVVDLSMELPGCHWFCQCAGGGLQAGVLDSACVGMSFY